MEVFLTFGMNKIYDTMPFVTGGIFTKDKKGFEQGRLVYGNNRVITIVSVQDHHTSVVLDALDVILMSCQPL